MSSGALQLPEHGTVLWIQRPEGDSPGHVSWPAVRKPAELEMLGQPEWHAFSARVHRNVGRIRREATLFRPALNALGLGVLGIILGPLITFQITALAGGRRLASAAPSSQLASDNVTTYTKVFQTTCASQRRENGSWLDLDECKDLCAADPCCCGYTSLPGLAYFRGSYRRTCELVVGDACEAEHCHQSTRFHMYYKDNHDASVCSSGDGAEGIFDSSSLLTLLAAVPGAFVISMSLMFLCVARFVFVKTNREADRRISKACLDLSENTGVSVRYLASCTGFWTAGASKSRRAIVMSKVAVNDQLHMRTLADVIELCSVCQTPRDVVSARCKCKPSEPEDEVSAVADASDDIPTEPNLAAMMIIPAQPALIEAIAPNAAEEPIILDVDMCIDDSPPASAPLASRPTPKMGTFRLFVVTGLRASETRPRLGMRLEDVDEGLKVVEILPEGMVAFWNESQANSPELIVKPGDCILKVNGVAFSGDHDAMLEAMMANSADVDLVVKCGAGEPTPTAEA
eukprot:TRINITY_DN1069_c0_g1_i5.p1 TRINITY_DN1069_c0_g1~~TRINITY_DN1069_c0_g1_i5.p1  ORF type:complete len:515 (+),score=66.72 TRINITY_DN1069_c0_g1_i5:145-1689(+)